MDPCLLPDVRVSEAQERALFAVPALPPSAMTAQHKSWSQILLHPPSAAHRKDKIMRSWLSAAIPGEFRRNNNCLKQANGRLVHVGRAQLNISAAYWQWLANSDAPPHPASALFRRAVRCDEQHNRDGHSRDEQWFACPFEHAVTVRSDSTDAEWVASAHTYEHLVCAACEAAQPDHCSPLVRQMLTDGPLVAMCEACALAALQRHGPGHNGCECTRGAFGHLCLQHQHAEAAWLARRWLAYRARHHGPGGYDEQRARHVAVPYCRCGRVPVPRSRRPFAFWCAACSRAVLLPDVDANPRWQRRKKPQRWLLPGNLPAADYAADWIARPSTAPPYEGQIVDPDDYRPAERRPLPAYPPRPRTPPLDILLLQPNDDGGGDDDAQRRPPAGPGREPSSSPGVPLASLRRSGGPPPPSPPLGTPSTAAGGRADGTAAAAAGTKRHKSQWSVSSVGAVPEEEGAKVTHPKKAARQAAGEGSSGAWIPGLQLLRGLSTLENPLVEKDQFGVVKREERKEE